MLDSLARQSWTGTWEVVVADNGSTDRSPEIARSYAGRLPRLAVVDASAQRGIGFARNEGVRHSSGAKLLFLDGDDEVADGYVAAMADALDRDVLVSARLEAYRLNAPWILDGWPALEEQDEFTDMGFLPFAGGCGMGVGRAVFDHIGGFSTAEPLFEDADLSWRIQLAGFPGPVFAGGATVHYRLPVNALGFYRRSRNYTRKALALHELYGDRGMRRPRKPSLRDLAGAARRARSRSGVIRAAGTFGRFVGCMREGR